MNRSSTYSAFSSTWDYDIKPAGKKILYFAMCDFSKFSRDGLAFPSVGTLAKKTSLSIKTVRKHLKGLVEMGLLVDTGIRKGSTKQIPAYKVILSKKNIPLVNYGNGCSINNEESCTYERLPNLVAFHDGDDKRVPKSVVFHGDAGERLPILVGFNGDDGERLPNLVVLKTTNFGTQNNLYITNRERERKSEIQESLAPELNIRNVVGVPVSENEIADAGMPSMELEPFPSLDTYHDFLSDYDFGQPVTDLAVADEPWQIEDTAMAEEIDGPGDPTAAEKAREPGDPTAVQVGAAEGEGGPDQVPGPEKKTKQAKKRRKVFVKPTIEQVREYSISKYGNDALAEAFFDHFTSNGWKVGGKGPMVDWQAAFRNWVRREPSYRGRGGNWNQNQRPITTEQRKKINQDAEKRKAAIEQQAKIKFDELLKRHRDAKSQNGDQAGRNQKIGKFKKFDSTQFFNGNLAGSTA